MNPFDYVRNDHPFNLDLVRETPAWRRYRVDFPAAYETRHVENHTARGDYYRPVGEGPSSLVVLLHGVGDRSVVPCGLLARSFAADGIACFVLYLVVHTSRMSPDFRRRMPMVTDDEWYETYRTSVIEVRQILDWAEGRPELDAGRVALLGISFGGFVSSIAMGIDERVTAGVTIVSGGNSAKIAQKGPLTSLSRRYRVSDREYRETLAAYADYLAEVAEKGFEAVVPSRRSFQNDSMTFASRLRDRPLLMVNGRWDELIPREAALDFWNACGCPEILWLPATHVTIWLWYRTIRRRVHSFLDAAFRTADAPAQ
jgi:cephalosporin-C deacetylase-like acetyl esterase